MKHKIFTFLTILIFANGLNIKRDEESSNGGDLLGSNTKSVPTISKSSIRNLVNSVNIPDEEPIVVKRPKHYNPEAVYNHIVNVKGPHHRERFDRISQHFPIWEDSLKHVKTKLYGATIKTLALKIAMMNSTQLQVENVNDYVTNSILNKFAYPLHGIEVPNFTNPINYYSNNTNNTFVQTPPPRGKPVPMEPLRHTFEKVKDLDVTPTVNDSKANSSILDSNSSVPLTNDTNALDGNSTKDVDNSSVTIDNNSSSNEKENENDISDRGGRKLLTSRKLLSSKVTRRRRLLKKGTES